MAELRNGTYGEYYGCLFNESHALTREQMQVNAAYVYSFLSAAGWSVEAVAGLLGNMEHESSINPGRWQSDNVGNMSGGYSLVQWTPATNYTEWSAGDPSEMDNALGRILYELDNGLQYYLTPDYPLTFREFSKSKDAPYNLACAFAWNYERSWTVLYGTEAEKQALREKRGGAANVWYEFLTGIEPIDPVDKKRKSMPLLLMFMAARRKI